MLEKGSGRHREHKESDILIFTRKEGELIAIGNDILVNVIAVQGSQVRIGISAPREVEVHREEVWKRINDQVIA